MRRRCQILEARPDLWVENVRGNIDTRIRKLLDGDQFDAIVLAAAGLKRSGMYDESIMTSLRPVDVLPAAGQGALAIQCRRRDTRTRTLLGALNDPRVKLCVEIERAVVSALGGDCHSPIAAFACIDETDGRIILQAAVGARGGSLPVIRSAAEADVDHPVVALSRVLNSLAAQGAAELLGVRRSADTLHLEQDVLVTG
jgi:hydroxymethylbilane synthase